MNATPARRRPIGDPQTVCATAVILAGLLGHAAQAQPPQGSQGPTPQGPTSTIVQPVSKAAPPYRGLFGVGSPAAPSRHLLDLTASVYQEYGNSKDSEIPTESVVLGDGWFLGVRGGLSFEKAGQHTRFGLRGEGSFRYYRDTRQTTIPRFRVEVGVDGKTGQRRQDSVRVAGSVDYEPYYILPFFTATVPVTGGTAILPTSRDDLLFRRTRYIYGQSFGFEHQVSPRTYVSVSEDARYTQADTLGLDVRTIRVGARYGYRVSRYAALRLGYAYQMGRYGPEVAQRMATHDAEVSLDYRKPLSRSRRTTIGFAAASSRVTAQLTREWTMVGTANLRHEFGGGWFIQGDFRRNVQLVEGFSDPFFMNTATASLGGFMGRRVELFASGGYSRGVIGFGSDKYTALQGSTRLRVALARFLAVDTEGLINENTFDNRVPIPGVVPATLNRWAVRCNVALWLPLSR